MALVFLGAFSQAQAQNVSGYESIPDPMLYLMREPAVHRELKLSDQQRERLVELNSSSRKPDEPSAM